MQLYWWLLLTLAGIAIGTVWKWRPKSTLSGSQRAEQKQKKERRVLADRILTYARKMQHRYPTGDVVVSEHDLAGELRKQPDAIATALDLLLGEQKVKRTPLNGYWKLNA